MLTVVLVIAANLIVIASIALQRSLPSWPAAITLAVLVCASFAALGGFDRYLQTILG